MSIDNQDLDTLQDDPFVVPEENLESNETEDLISETNIFEDIPDDDLPAPAGDNGDDLNLGDDPVGDEDGDDDPDNGKNPLDTLFGDEDMDGDDLGDEINEDEVQEQIKKLEALNYKVVKPGENPEENANQDEFHQEKLVIENNRGFIADAVDFIKKSDEDVVRVKLKTDVLQISKQEGTNLSEEQVRNQVENLLDEYSPTVLKTYAETLRAQVQNSALERKKEIEDVQKKIDSAIQQRQTEIKKKTQNAFKDIRKSQFFGIKLENEDIRQAYKNLTTGKVAKQIEDDPNIAAEVALFLFKKKEFSEKLGGPTYGEGVRDALKEALGNDVTNSSTQSVISKNASGRSTESSRLEAWLNTSSKDEKN